MAHFTNGLVMCRDIMNNMMKITGINESRVFERKMYQENKEEMMCTIYEAVRVLKPGKRFVIWPEPRYLCSDMMSYFRGNHVYTQREKIDVSDLSPSIRAFLEKVDEANYRLAITKL